MSSPLDVNRRPADFDDFHPIILRNDEWWACEYPERPWDHRGTWFAVDCRPCVLALGAAAMHDRETLIGFTRARLELPMGEAYEVCRVEHGLPELPGTVR
jgi:hypothetical protein